MKLELMKGDILEVSARTPMHGFGSGSIRIRIHETFRDMDPVAKPIQIIWKYIFFSQKYYMSKYFISIQTEPNLVFNKKTSVKCEEYRIWRGWGIMSHTHSFSLSFNWILHECITIKHKKSLKKGFRQKSKKGGTMSKVQRKNCR